MSDRCTRSNANAAWTCVLPEGHEGDHIYTLWSEIAIHAEAAIQRVRSACNRIIENAQRFDLDDEHGLVYGQWMTAKSILRALDGDAEPELDISISSYAKEADDGEAMWNDGGDA